MIDVEALKNLQKEMAEYGEYLEKFTYQPYTEIQSFARKLKEIIKKHEENTF